MNNATTQQLIETLKSLCDRSEACWEDAIFNAAQSRRLAVAADASACIDLWVDAIQALECLQHSAAIESLQQAAAIAWPYGDNQSEEEGIKAIEGE